MTAVGDISVYMANHATTEADQKSWSDGGCPVQGVQSHVRRSRTGFLSRKGSVGTMISHAKTIKHCTHGSTFDHFQRQACAPRSPPVNTLLDLIKLREYAILLDVAIHDNINLSKDVEFLANYQPLVTAIADAKAGKVESPRDLGGLGRWLLESNIRDFPVLSDRLSGFRLPLRGWNLPPEYDAV